MNLFKAKTADQLEEKLMNIVNGFSHTVGLKDEVTTKVKNAEGHIKLGTMGGLGIGALGVLGGIASIPLIPAIATTALVGGFTVAGVAIMSGGAGMMAGLAYAGIGKLYAKYQESKLGDITSKIFEEHRMKIEDNKFERDFSNKFHKQTDYKTYSEHLSLYDLKEAVKQGDMTRAQELVKGIVAKAEMPEGTKTKKAPLFKEPIATDLTKSLGNFFDTYKSKALGLENQNKIADIEHKMLGGVMFATGGAAIAVTGLVAVSSFALASGGLALGVAALAYTGIKAIHKMVLSNKQEHEFKKEADAYIVKASKDLNIDVTILEDVKNHIDYKRKSELKDLFVEKTVVKDEFNKKHNVKI